MQENWKKKCWTYRIILLFNSKFSFNIQNKFYIDNKCLFSDNQEISNLKFWRGKKGWPISMWLHQLYSQALVFLLVLAGCSVLCGRLCYCLSFSLSKVQCYLCNKKVKYPQFKPEFLMAPDPDHLWIGRIMHIYRSFDQRTFNICCICMLYLFFHQIHPTSKDQEYEYLHLLDIFFFS